MKLSLVIPCYNEQDNVELFYNTATEVFKDKGFDYELIFVNDGSRDQTMDKLRHIYEIFLLLMNIKHIYHKIQLKYGMN